jgi:hypothetical protein
MCITCMHAQLLSCLLVSACQHQHGIHAHRSAQEPCLPCDGDQHARVVMVDEASEYRRG